MCCLTQPIVCEKGYFYFFKKAVYGMQVFGVASVIVGGRYCYDMWLILSKKMEWNLFC